MSRGPDLAPDENERVQVAVRNLLREYNDNQSELARQLGVKPSTINQGMSGKNGASLQLAKAVAKKLGVWWPELLTGKQAQTGYVPAHLEDDEKIRRTYEFAVEVLGDTARACMNTVLPAVLSSRCTPYLPPYWLARFLIYNQRNPPPTVGELRLAQSGAHAL